MSQSTLNPRVADGRWRRREGRWQRKMRAAQRIPFCGLIVTRAIVKRHRYLREQGLPHSAPVADVLIQPTAKETNHGIGSIVPLIASWADGERGRAARGDRSRAA